MKSILIAATALALGFGAATLPAFAQADDYGQYRYTQNDPTRFAPAGEASENAGARDIARQRVFDRIDTEHSQY